MSPCVMEGIAITYVGSERGAAVNLGASVPDARTPIPCMSRRPKAIVLLNPRARRARRANAPEWRDAVCAALAARYESEFVVPDSAADTGRIAREAALDSPGVVVAAGGDGTVNAVAGGLSGSQVPLGILPLGTANDLARELGIPRDPRDAVARLAAGQERRVDLVSVNGRAFCGVGGLVLVSASALAPLSAFARALV